tara:strand:- start:73 stop:702 length:630 start_codon:yes stop_codon:yes gene_type:complete
MSIKVLKPFGPSVVKARLPDEIISEMNNYIDQVVKNTQKSKELDYGDQLAGNVKQEIVLEKDFMQKIKWIEYLASITQKWINFETKKNISEFKLLSSWVVRQFRNEYNPTHFHDGHISGVGYLKVPTDFGKYSQSKKTHNRNGRLELIHGSRMFLCNANHIIKPEVGDIYLFPNYLLHSVWPFTDSDEERRSVSFNAVINKEVANVYGS